jgi:HD-GYP domain-containing protein (c-di-GMP phosphodiesterase class II)
MARETDLIFKGASRALRKDKSIEEGGQLKTGDPFIGPWQQAEQPEEEMTLEQCQETYNKLFEFVKGIMKAAGAENSFSLEQGSKVISDILRYPNIIDWLYANTLAYQNPSDLLVYHSINVFICSVKIGMALGYSRRQLLELSIAALLHDIGMTKVPEQIIKKTNQLSNKELDTIKKHPIYGHEIITKLGKKYMWLAKVVLQEHEREQGQGYPEGIKGNEIHEYAKIIGVADVYEALTHPRPHRREALPYEAIEELKALFSLKILKAFLTQLTMYPLGCYVKLNSNVIGRVTAVNTDSPLQPIIEPVCDSQGRSSEPGQVINLSQEPFLHIVECLHQEDLPHSTL